MPVRIIAVIFLYIGCIFSVQAKVYKWVDEKGETHFSDHIPTKYRGQKHQELNQQGGLIKQYPAPETAEQKIQRKRLEAARKKVELARKKKQQRDRVLLDTYTTERDLTLARDARLDAINSQIILAESIINDSSKKIEGLNKQISSIKKSGRAVPKNIFKRLANEKQLITLHNKLAAKDKKRRAEITQQFEGYIKRFRVLKAEQQAKRKKILQEGGL